MFFKKNVKPGFSGGVLIIFNSAEEAISAEYTLKGASLATRLVAPPPHLRKGCDLAIEVNLKERDYVEQLLREHQVSCLAVVSLRDDQENLKTKGLDNYWKGR